jgi:hypothetical protein
MDSIGDAPAAVLLDGVFVLPDSKRILGDFTRAECCVPREVLAEAHYRAAAKVRHAPRRRGKLDRGLARLPPGVCRRVPDAALWVEQCRVVAMDFRPSPTPGSGSVW